MTVIEEQHSNGASRARSLRQRAPLLILIFVSALGFRTCGAITAPVEPVADAADYHRLASGLAEGRGYVNESGQQTAWRPPGYPFFLAAIYEISGPHISAAVLVQVLIGALTVLALVAFGAIVISWRAALVAGFIAAVYPGFVWLPRLLLSENLSLLLLLLTLLATALYLKTNCAWWLGVMGVVGGLNALARGGNIIVPVIICGVLLVIAIRQGSARLRQILLGVLLAAAAFAIVLTPWTIRNYRVFHRFFPVATQEGLTLYASYWPPEKNGRLIWGTLPGIEDPAVAASAQLGDEVSASRYLSSVTRERLIKNPGYFFRLIPTKMISLLVPLDWEIFPHAAGQTRVVNFGYLLILLPAMLGFVVLWRQRGRMHWLLWVVPITVLIQTIFFYGSPRFRLPVEPIAILVGAAGLSAAYAFLKSRTSLLGYKTKLP